MIKIIYARNVQIDIKSLQNITMKMNVSFIFNSNQQFLDGNITSEIEIQFASPIKYYIRDINPTIILYFWLEITLNG